MVGAKKRRSRRTALLAVALSGVLAWFAVAGTELARAGDYSVIACHDAGGAAMPADLVVRRTTGVYAADYFRTSDTCAAGAQGAVNAEVGNCAGCAFGNLGISSSLEPPADVSISAYRVRFVEATRACDATPDHCGSGQGENFAIDSQHAPPNYAFRTLGSGFGGPYEVAASGIDAKSLTFFTGCDATNGPCPAGGIVAGLYVSHLSAVLHDRTSPTVLGEGGPLMSGRPVSGVQTVSYSAQDAGGGIYAEHAFLDGVLKATGVVDSNAGRCLDHGTVPGLHSFGFVQPCPTSVHAAMSFDTTKWSDGPHRFKVEVEDAAGDRATVFEGQVMVANGAAGSGGAGPSARDAACSPAASGKLVVGSHGLATLRARLTCAGRPLAAVRALVQDDRGLRKQVTTGADGAFRVTTRHTHSHLSVLVSGAKVAIATQLRAISLAITPRVTRNHHAMTWRGKVTGGHAGMKLLLEVRKGRSWNIFDQTSVAPSGAYRYRYRFRATTGTVRYSFRVVARDGSAMSPSRSILVRG